jgi:hypothetical protein
MENSRTIIKKRNHNMRDEQKKSLSDYVCSNRRLNSGKQLNNYNNRMMKEEWEQLVLQLNSIRGANKNGAGWKIKEEYYRNKLELLKRQTVAQEELVQCIKKYFE